MSIDWSAVNWQRWSETAWTHGARVVIVVIAVLIVLRIARRVIKPAIEHAVSVQMEGQPEVEINKRVDTLTAIVYGAVWTAAVLVGLMTTLPEFGINTTALLAGTSLAGLAIGFGAQSLVKDVISGLFVLVENQYAKGDVVNIGGVGGLVEDITLRRTVLRDLDGAIHSVPNGQVTVASNLTRTWSRANMVVTVSYAEDTDHVFAVIDRTGEELARDPDWSGDIIEAPRVIGIENFGDSGVDIRILGVTQPIRQWDVMRELRRRLKSAFDREGIEIPFPHRTLVTYGQKATNNLLVRLANESPRPSAAQGRP